MSSGRVSAAASVTTPRIPAQEVIRLSRTGVVERWGPMWTSTRVAKIHTTRSAITVTSTAAHTASTRCQVRSVPCAA